ncbi:MAG: twin-arginine translocase TatA/TatE family subunit [Calditrichaeota bacterium]|nr:twin-arginine translocase TatA/TatE family subunit [Calditrichota bacterium]
MFGLGPWELLVIFVVIIILFGPKRLPELARSLGRSIKEFKHASQGLKEELDLTNIDEPSIPESTANPAEKTQKKDQETASAKNDQ